VSRITSALALLTPAFFAVIVVALYSASRTEASAENHDISLSGSELKTVTIKPHSKARGHPTSEKEAAPTPAKIATQTKQEELSIRNDNSQASVYYGDLSAALINNENTQAVAKAAIFGIENVLTDNALNGDRAETELTHALKEVAKIANSNAGSEEFPCELEGTLQIKKSHSGAVDVALSDCNFNGESLSGNVRLENHHKDEHEHFFAAHYELDNHHLGAGSLECADDSLGCSSSRDYRMGATHYRTEDSAVTGDERQGFTVGSRVYSDSLGYIDTLAIDMVPCNGGGFSSGLIGIADATSETVVTIEYTDCNQYKLTYHGA
jgi:hypothetical protein